MIRPGVKYTFAQLEGFREDPSLADWAAKGYVWRQELDGTLQLVHYTKSHMDNAIRRIEQADPAFWEHEGAQLARTLVEGWPAGK